MRTRLPHLVRHHEGHQTPDTSPNEDRSPVVVLGGLLTDRHVEFLYHPLLTRDTTSTVPAAERFIPPPHHGLGDVERIRREVEEKALRLYEKLGERRMRLFGHSLGGLEALFIALDHPEIVEEVTFIAGAQDGINKKTSAYWALRLGLGNPKEAKLLDHDSSFISEQRERVQTEWLQRIGMHVMATAADPLIEPPQGFDLQPPGQQPRKTLIVPNVPIPGVRRRVARVERETPADVQRAPTRHLIEHVFIPLASHVLRTVGPLPEPTPIETAGGGPVLFAPAALM